MFGFQNRNFIFPFIFSFCRPNDEIRVNRFPSAGDGRCRQDSHALYQTGPGRGHGTDGHVDDAQARPGLAKDKYGQQASNDGRKTFGTLEEVHTRGGEFMRSSIRVPKKFAVV